MTFFKKILYLFSKEEKKYIILLLLFAVFVSMIELVGISAIMLFISTATDPMNIEKKKYLFYIYNLFGFENYNDFIIFMGIALVLFYLFRAFINLIFFYFLSSFTQRNYQKWASDLFLIYLKMPFQEFSKHNSSTLIKVITTEVQHLVNIITSLLTMASELLIFIFIYFVMLWVNFEVTLFLTLFLLFNTWIMVRLISPKVKQAGIDREEYQKDFYEVVAKSLSNYKLIKLHSLNTKIYNDFYNIGKGFKKANVINITLSNLPRLYLESVSFSLVILIIVYLIWNGNNNISDVMATITFFLLSLYRLMPSINRILYGYNQILFYHRALDIIYDNYKLPTEKLSNEFVKFEHCISLKNIVFKYDKNTVLQDINLEIKKNQKIAFIGESGSGKSTLVNLIIGLYTPTKGSIHIDNTLLCQKNLNSWRKKIGYIPQEPYLFDGTVKDNVVFGNDFDEKKLIHCLKESKIYDLFESKNGLETIIGENGINISGGQKQRIAIARALYNDPEILVLDEATSALDYELEKEIMSAVYNICRDKTLIIIAHRLSTIQGCDVIYKLENGIIQVS